MDVFSSFCRVWLKLFTTYLSKIRYNVTVREGILQEEADNSIIFDRGS
jgi:hypothetical protein